MGQENDNCKSCEAVLNGSYCSQCGQKVIDQRYTFRRIFNNLLNTIFNYEKGFLFTVKQLFVAPGAVVKNYLSGQTIRYYNPFRFVFIMATASVILGLIVGIYETQTENMNEIFGVNADEDTIARQHQINEAMKPYLNFFSILIIPFISAMSFWLFKKKGYNLAEHVVGNSFLLGQSVFIGLGFIPLYLFFPSLLNYALFFGIILNTIYFSYAYSQWFELRTRTALLKAFLSIIGGYVLMFTSLFLSLAIIIFVYILFKKVFLS